MALEFLYFIDPKTMVLGLLFIVLFAVINFALMKSIKNRGLSTIISFSISLLAVYGINRSRFDPSEMLYNIGLTQDALYTAVPILIILGIILLSRRFGFGKVLLIVGVILAGLSFTELIYEKGVVLAIGIGLILIGGILAYRKNKRDKLSGADWKKQADYKAGLKKKDKIASSQNNSRALKKQRRYNRKRADKIARQNQRQQERQQQRDNQIRVERTQQEQRVQRKQQRDNQRKAEREQQKAIQKEQKKLAKGASQTKDYATKQGAKAKAYATKKVEQVSQAGKKINQKIGEAAGYTRAQVKQFNKEIEKRIETEKIKQKQTRLQNEQYREQKKDELARAYAEKELRKRKEKEQKIRKERLTKEEDIKKRRIKRLQDLYKQKSREWQKQTMMAAKGIKNAADKAKTLKSEIQYIVDEVNRISKT